jgi:hypothetical protein
VAKQSLTNTRAQKTKNRETLKKHRHKREHTTTQTAASNTERTTRSTQKPNKPTPQLQPKPAKRNAKTLWLHSLRRNTKITSGKASAKVKKNHGGKASTQARRGGKASTDRHEQRKQGRSQKKKLGGAEKKTLQQYSISRTPHKRQI